MFKPPSLWYFVTTILRKIFKLVTEVLGRLGSLEHEACNLTIWLTPGRCLGYTHKDVMTYGKTDSEKVLRAIASVWVSRSVVSNSLQPHEL